MKDNQQMSVEISNHNDMAVQALAPLSLKENGIFPVDSAEEDLLDEDFHLHLSEDEDEDKNQVTTKISADSHETEDDILDKFVSTDTDSEELLKVNGESESMESTSSEDKNSDESEAAKSEVIVNGVEEVEEEKENEEVIENGLKEEEKKEDGEVVQNGLEEEEKKDQDEIVQNGIEEEEKKDEDDVIQNGIEEKEKKDEVVQNAIEEEEKKDEDDKVIQNGTEEEEEEKKENDESFEEQIMDTEHLLQVADKQQEDGEDTKDSCSSLSETADKSEDTEAETEKIENGEEEEEEASKTNDKVEESMDIEETNLLKDDLDNAEVDKEYENIANEEKTEEEVEPSDAKQEEEEEVLDSTPKTSKRPLSEADSPNDSKKPKLSDEPLETKEPEPEPKPAIPLPPPPPKIKVLNIISEFMQKKKLKRLTREDLEQICLMKMCEAIGHKSEIGELRHQLGVQEQMIDMWRKEAAQLTKQARDLEIVNKRLLHEVRMRNDRDKPLIPVKITRSVGLQVRSDNNLMNNVLPNPKRRFSRTQTVTTPVKPLNRSTTKPVTPVTTPVNTSSKPSTNKITIPGKTAQQVLKPKTILPKSPSSLLSKALQNSAAQASTTPTVSSSHTPASNTSPVTTTSTPSPSAQKSQPTPPAKPTPTAKPTKTVESKIIDLTDEDDKKPTPVTSSIATLSTAQGVRIVSAPVKTTAVVSNSSVVNPPRIMYVYNNQLHQGVIATDSTKIGNQKIMLKLNSNVIGPANGVIVSNGSTLAVSTGNIRTTQVPLRLSTPITTVRTTQATKPSVLKHPAPLPPPPITQMGIAARKPIPPKPHLSIRRSSGGIVLSWKMPYTLDNFESIASYQLYAYQETTSTPSSDMWRKVGDVKALALPMACTLTQFADGNKYHFAVRAVDVQKRMGPFSDPEQILL